MGVGVRGGGSGGGGGGGGGGGVVYKVAVSGFPSVCVNDFFVAFPGNLVNLSDSEITLVIGRAECCDDAKTNKQKTKQNKNKNKRTGAAARRVTGKNTLINALRTN